MNEKEIKQKVSQGYIHFRSIIEIIGKPKKHVINTLNNYIEKIEKSKDLSIVKKELANPKKQENSKLYAIFAELEILVSNTKRLIEYCFDYMPSSVEIIDPEQLFYKKNDFTDFLNDMQARLHNVNMTMQDYKQRNSNLIKNTATLLKNFVLILLKEPKTKNQIKKYLGIKEHELNKLLDAMVKQNLIQKKNEVYYIKNG
jgi:predicted transcriptional regulator